MCFGPQQSERYEAGFKEGKVLDPLGKKAAAANNVIVHVCFSVFRNTKLFKTFLHFVSRLLLLSETYVSFISTLCHAPLSGSLLCSALKAMCARSCSCGCGLPDVDQQSSNIFMVPSSYTHTHTLVTQLHRMKSRKLSVESYTVILHTHCI